MITSWWLHGVRRGERSFTGFYMRFTVCVRSIVNFWLWVLLWKLNLDHLKRETKPRNIQSKLEKCELHLDIWPFNYEIVVSSVNTSLIENWQFYVVFNNPMPLLRVSLNWQTIKDVSVINYTLKHITSEKYCQTHQLIGVAEKRSGEPRHKRNHRNRTDSGYRLTDEWYHRDVSLQLSNR